MHQAKILYLCRVTEALLNLNKRVEGCTVHGFITVAENLVWLGYVAVDVEVTCGFGERHCGALKVFGDEHLTT